MDASPLWVSLKVASLATLAAAVSGTVLAHLWTRVRSGWLRWLDVAFTLPMVLPPTVLGYYLLVLLGRRGWFGRWFEAVTGFPLLFTWQGAVVAAAVVAFPLVYQSAKAAFEGVDPQLEGAARTLGFSEPAVFLRVSLPQARRGILAGCALAFARAMGEFGATLMVAGNVPGRTQTLSLAIYSAAQAGDDRLAWQLVILTSVACAVILVASGRLLQPRR